MVEIRAVVLGVGNILLKDEGIGVFLINKLKEQQEKGEIRDSIEILDGGTSSFDILAGLGIVDKLVIVDAIKGKGKPGSVYRMEYGDLIKIAENNESKLSVHDMSIFDSIEGAKKLGNVFKEIVFIGIEPKDINLGDKISKALENNIDNIIKIIKKEVVLGGAK